MLNTELQEMRILIVDDEPAVIGLLEDVLRNQGYFQFRATTDPRQAMSEYKSFQPHLILLDLMMPYLDGFAVLKQFRAGIPANIFLPIMVLTSDVTDEFKIRALTLGATDFLTKPFDMAEVKLRIRNLLQSRRAHDQLEEQNRTLEDKVRERTRELRLTLTELQVKQQQIVRQERLHALGSMASGIVHDFNNVLTLIIGRSELLQHQQREPEVKEGLSEIITAAQDGAAMIGRLREFYRSRDTSEPRSAVQLNELIPQTVALTRPKWKDQALGRGVTIQIDTDLKEVPPIQANATELREMLTNLIFNAVDAMSRDGTITLRTSTKEDQVIAEIADTGSGMSPEVQMRCLEPLFTTKGESGTGMGLAMVYGTIQRHGGSINIESEPGKGTTFKIQFPLAPGSLKKAEAEVSERMDGALRILAVDSDTVVLDILAERLRLEGHQVKTASSAMEAVNKLQNGVFDLVLTNQAMPEMTGEDLGRFIRKIAPKTKVIMLTGFGVSAGEVLKSGTIDLVVAKPVTIARLREALWTCFGPEVESK